MQVVAVCGEAGVDGSVEDESKEDPPKEDPPQEEQPHAVQRYSFVAGWPDAIRFGCLRAQEECEGDEQPQRNGKTKQA